MIQILKSGNDYYIKEFNIFYGSFHSVADCETYIKNGKDSKHRLESLPSYKLVKYYY